jgi:hypothetical protein
MHEDPLAQTIIAERPCRQCWFPRARENIFKALSARRFGLWSRAWPFSETPMPPLSLSDEELSLLRTLAEPVAYGRRGEFMQAVAAELKACPEPGPGATYRVARDVQRRYTLTSQRVAPEPPPNASKVARL